MSTNFLLLFCRKFNVIRVREFGPGMVIMNTKGQDLWPCKRLMTTSEVTAEPVDDIKTMKYLQINRCRFPKFLDSMFCFDLSKSSSNCWGSQRLSADARWVDEFPPHSFLKSRRLNWTSTSTVKSQISKVYRNSKCVKDYVTTLTKFILTI